MPQARLDLLALGTCMVELTPDVPGQPIREADRLVPTPSGATANFAVAAARLALKVGLLSRVGDDEWGQWLRARLAQAGIDTSAIRPVPRQFSPVSFCWMDQEGNKTFYFYRFPGHCDPLSTLRPEELEPSLFQGVRCFDFSEATIRREPLRSAAFRAVELARCAGAMVVYAVNWRPASWPEGEDAVAVQRRACSVADVVLMNADEAAMIAGGPPEQAAEAIAGWGPRVVAVTMGAEGAVVAHKGGVQHIPAFDVPVQYDIGAGDAFHAGLVAGLLHGLEPPQAAALASAVAALRISRHPSEPPPTLGEAAELAGLEIGRTGQ